MYTFKAQVSLALFFVLLFLGTSAYAQRPSPPARTRVKPQLSDTTRTPSPAEQNAAVQNTETKAEAMDEEEEEKFVKVKDTTHYPLLTELHFLLDYGKILTLPTPFEKKAEVGVQVLFKNRYLAGVSYGYGSINPTNAYRNSGYNATGTYIKPGLFYQLSINPKNKFLLGAQYGLASFEDSGTTVVESGSGLFEPYQSSYARSNLTASWWELCLQSEGNFRGNLWLGFRLSYRSLINHSNPGNPDVLVVPGYGKTVNGGVAAVNLFVKYKISFFKPAPLPGQTP